MPAKHSDYVNAIKSVAMKTGKDLLVREGLKRLPFLFAGPLGPLGNKIVEEIMEILIRESEFAIFFKYIDLRVDSQSKDFSDAAVRNYHAQMSGTPEEKAKAEAELIQAFKNFAKLNT